jgi:hypothetical protein
MMWAEHGDYESTFYPVKGNFIICRELILHEGREEVIHRSKTLNGNLSFIQIVPAEEAIAHFNFPHVVKYLKKSAKYLKRVTCNTTLPLIIADKIPQDKPVSDDVVLELIKKYNLPRNSNSNKFLREKQQLYLKDGSQVLAFYPLDTLKSQLVDIKAAVLLWQAFLEDDVPKIRRLFAFRRDGRTRDEYMPLELSFHENLPENFDQGADMDDDEVIKFASWTLCKMIVHGFEGFPPSSKVEVEEEGRFRHAPHPLDPFSYVWSVILNDLSRSDARRKWHYRKCKGYREKVDEVWKDKPCSHWEDVSKPNRRATRWTRCDKCQYEHQKEKSQKKRDKERAQDSNRRKPGRPKKSA